jgi:hypothetical protein
MYDAEASQHDCSNSLASRPEGNNRWTKMHLITIHRIQTLPRLKEFQRILVHAAGTPALNLPKLTSTDLGSRV